MDKYDFVEEIGSGTYATVNLMKHKQTKQLVAVKLMDLSRVVHGRIESEIKNHSLLQHHPNIISLKEVFTTPTHIAIVMEYAQGGELLQRFCNGVGLDENTARYFFQQLISGVSYCHENQICHRDLKVENLLLESDFLTPRLKICDFGFSKNLTSSSSKCTSKLGSLPYMAPEVISANGERPYDGKMADVWSCGVILYSMLVGFLMFDAPGDEEENVKKITEDIMAARYVIPDYVHLSADSKHLLSRIIVVDPSMRITIQEIQRHPWFVKNLPKGLKKAVCHNTKSSAESTSWRIQTLNKIMKSLKKTSSK